MKIRKINIDDLETLRNLSIQTFKETFEEVNTEEDMQKYLDENLSIEKLKTELENVNSEFYFAENNDEILGYLKLNFKDAQTEKLEETIFEIERIYVLKAFLGQKSDKFSLKKAIEIGREKNLEYVWLGVWEENHRAKILRKKMVLKSSKNMTLFSEKTYKQIYTHENTENINFMKMKI